jgi:hypothetical protein
MSSRALCAVLLLLAAVRLGAQDWETYAARSDRSMDGLILQNMAEGDFETRIALCKGLGRRNDQDVQAIIDALVSQRGLGADGTSELLLRWLIGSARDAHPQGEAFRAWAAANARSVDMLLDRMQRWKSAQLKGALLSLAVIAPENRGANAVMDVGLQVVHELQVSPDGLMPAQDTALALDFLAAARQLPSRDFFTVCADIARLSREKVLVDAARAAARELASAR